MNLQTIGAAIGSAKGKKIDLSPLRFTNTGDSAATVEFSDDYSAQPNFKIRQSEDAAWQSWDYSAVTLQPGEYMEICGTNENSITNYDDGEEEGSKFVMTGTISASGNIMSLAYEDLDADNTLTIPQEDTEHGYFGYLFGDCESLTAAPTLPATTLAKKCYKDMFYRCTGLTAAPTLPATTLAEGCYNNMFAFCTGLTAAPTLPATTLAKDCCGSMFGSCTGLTTAPTLPATTLAEGCYSSMFYGCTGLTVAPTLPATTLAEGCYTGMFSSCTGLTAVVCLATDISATSCTNNWLSGVAANGTFVKAAGMNDWTTGADGIPSGWTVQDA